MKHGVSGRERKRDGHSLLMDRRRFFGTSAASLSAGFVFLTVPWAASTGNAASETSARVGDVSAARGLLNRLFPGKKPNIHFELLPREKSRDFFQLASRDSGIMIQGSSVPALCSGLHWYLKYFCRLHLSWCGSRLDLPQELPPVDPPVRLESPFIHSVYFNYCTYGYTMPWWDWERWEKELDYMALNGVTLPLAITGVEAVWLNTLKRMGYSSDEAKEFISGPAYIPWWLMGNLEGWGGPLPDSWIESHVELGRKIIARMRELGMSPMMQGFVGLVPRSLTEKFPEANIMPQGKWAGGFERTAVLDPTDPLFEDMAGVWYEEQQKLFGKTRYFAGDLFHEGGKSAGVDVSEAARKVYAAMKEAYPDPVWVLQGWGKNPKPNILKALEPSQALILDLAADNDPQYPNRNGWSGHDWVWNTIVNFGGNPGMFGRLSVEAEEIPRLIKDERYSKNLVGIGTTPEGIENNPVVWELHFEMYWRKESPDLDAWISEYVRRRYGSSNSFALDAWKILARTAYNGGRLRANQSLICGRVRPSFNIISPLTWSPTRFTYDPTELKDACGLMINAASELGEVDAFAYDLVDLTRQVLSNLAFPIFKRMRSAYWFLHKEEFSRWGQHMLELIRDMDALLSTRKEFMLGTWLAAARKWGKTTEEKDLYEWNARLLVTVWGFKNGSLHDYSHREWSGLLQDFYLPRWQAFINYHADLLDGKIAAPPDYYREIEKPWTERKNKYPSEPSGDQIALAEELSKKYNNLIIEEKLYE